MSKLPTISDPWERLPGETDLAYSYFVSYMEMVPERSLTKVVQKHDKKSHYKTQLGKWSSQHDWVERAGKYDRHLQAKALEGKEEIIQSAKGRIYQQVHKALDELFTIMNGPDKHFTEGSTSLVSQKLKAIELTLKLAGVTPPESPQDEAPVTITNYIQNVYKRIEGIKKDKGND